MFILHWYRINMMMKSIDKFKMININSLFREIIKHKIIAIQHCKILKFLCMQFILLYRFIVFVMQTDDRIYSEIFKTVSQTKIYF